MNAGLVALLALAAILRQTRIAFVDGGENFDAGDQAILCGIANLDAGDFHRDGREESGLPLIPSIVLSGRSNNLSKPAISLRIYQSINFH